MSKCKVTQVKVFVKKLKLNILLEASVSIASADLRFCEACTKDMCFKFKARERLQGSETVGCLVYFVVRNMRNLEESQYPVAFHFDIQTPRSLKTRTVT